MKQFNWATILLITGMAACNDADGGKTPTTVVRPVKLLTLAEDHGARLRRFPGTVEARSEVEIAFRVGGPVIALPIEEGQRVKKGELLARIDPRDYRVRLRAAEARLEAAKAQLTHASTDHRRIEQLAKDDAIPTARLDDARARLDVAKAERLAADRALEAAQLALKDTSLRSPLVGTVALVRIERYQTVGSSQPVVVLQTEGELDVHIDVPEAELEPLLSAAPGSLSVRFPGHGEQDFAARVRAHQSRVDSMTRTYPVEVLVEAPPSNLSPGMTAELVWERKDAKENLSIPLSALGTTAKGDPVVFLFEEGILRRAVVKLGPVAEGRVTVTDGLRPGQQLLVAGVSAAAEGQRVRPLSAEDLGG